MNAERIELTDFTLERVNFFDEENISYIQGLSLDPGVEEFLPYMKRGLFISKNVGYLNSHYVALQHDHKVGYVFFSSPFIEDGQQNSEIRYIIDPNYRGMKLSNQLISESSDKMLELEGIENIRAYIDPANIKSQKAALSSNFEIVGEGLDGIIFNKPSKK